MAKKSPSEIYQDLIQVGYSPAAAVVQLAIDLAESGGDDTAVGDVSLENNVWGPSYGFGQVRTVKADTGRGGDRDINWLAASDINQAKAEYDISGGGHNFAPWTTYTSGAYQKFLGQAQSAAAGAGAAGGTATLTGATSSAPFGTWGPPWLPWNWAADLGNAAAGQAADATQAAVGEGLAGARSIAIEAAFVGLGIALVGFGLARAFAPQIREAKRAAVKGAEVAAVAA